MATVINGDAIVVTGGLGGGGGGADPRLPETIVPNELLSGDPAGEAFRSSGVTFTEDGSSRTLQFEAFGKSVIAQFYRYADSEYSNPTAGVELKGTGTQSSALFSFSPLVGDAQTVEVIASVNGGTLRLGTGMNLLLVNLPTVDPGFASALWNDSGTLKISAG